MKVDLITKIVSAVETALLSRVKNNTIFAEYYNRTDNKAPWKRQAQTPGAKEIKNWIMAVMAATDPDNPRRGELMRFYENCNTDLHLGSCIDNRILPIQCAQFKLVDGKGDADSEAHKLLEKPWFLELVRLICVQTFEGTKLIELFDLNEKGELKEVTEIPQSNFIAQKGIIIKEEFDNIGVSYKEGTYKDYYIQIGGDWNLGLLNQLAIIVLAKKLGLGSWMSYIEKFGVPPVFAITERMDSGRRDELFEMLQNFRMNHFAVLQGNEKIEVPNNYNVDAYNSFKSLINDVCNAEISKRIMGGTGTSDQKSFVGSAEVHERLLKYRHQVDKLLFKFYFNEEIKPRLVKLSSVYAPLDKLYFEFDEKETLTLKEILEAIKELSQYYEFDVDELVKITGLPITQIKNAMSSTQKVPDNGNLQKKKPNANLKAFTSPPFLWVDGRIYSATWDAATERIARQIYSGERKPADLDNDLVLKNYAALSKAAQTGWGEEYYGNGMARNMRDNLIHFAGAKSYNLLTKLVELKKASTTEDEFTAAAKKAVNLHNETYLNVEKQFTSASASAARDWQQFVKDMDIYPNLKLRTMEDSDVRIKHAELDGLVKPVKDWTVTPPFESRCRCRLEQTLDPVSAHIPSINTNAEYANNPGISGEAFTPKHNYFQSIAKSDKSTFSNNVNLMKQYAPYHCAQEMKNGNKVFVSDFADGADLDPNFIAAKKIAESLEKDVYIRPHSASNNGVKNPEFGIGKPSEFGDLKSYEHTAHSKPESFENYIVNGLLKANKQKCKYAVLDISQYKGDHSPILQRRLSGSLTLKINKSIENVIVINGNKVSSISRKNIYKRDFEGFLKGL